MDKELIDKEEVTIDKDKEIKNTEKNIFASYMLLIKPFIIFALILDLIKIIYESFVYGFSIAMLWSATSEFLVAIWGINILISAMASFISIASYYHDRLNAKRMMLLFFGMIPVMGLCAIPYFGYLISVKLYHKVITKNWDKEDAV